MIFLPQYLEELSPEVTDSESAFYVGEELLAKLPKARDCLEHLSFEEAERYAKYMEAGQIVFAWMGMVNDPFDRSTKIYTSDYSDGEFVWRDMHIHLVRKYRMDLPNEFKSHIDSFDGSVEHMKNLDQKELIKRVRLAQKTI